MAADGVHEPNIRCGRGDKKGVFTGLNLKKTLYIMNRSHWDEIGILFGYAVDSVLPGWGVGAIKGISEGMAGPSNRCFSRSVTRNTLGKMG
jgi:hypothetical protein